MIKDNQLSRSNGEFPGFEKIDLDPKTLPDKYWDSNRKCTSCDTHWPDTEDFVSPPCHPDFATVREMGAPDMRWDDAIRRLNQSRFDRYYEEWNEGRSDEELALEDVKTNGEVDEEKIKREIRRFLDNVAP